MASIPKRAAADDKTRNAQVLQGTQIPQSRPYVLARSSDITAKAQDAPMGLMTGAWEVPLPKPISPAALATQAGLHRVSPSTESIRRP